MPLNTDYELRVETWSDGSPWPLEYPYVTKFFPVIGVIKRVNFFWSFFERNQNFLKMFPLLYLKAEGREIHTDDFISL